MHFRVLSRLQRDESGVSPVISVILMVAITVVLSAVLGTFVLGMGDEVSTDAPSVTLDVSQTNTTYEDDWGEWWESEEVTITHVSGDAFSKSNVVVTVNGERAYGASRSSSSDHVSPTGEYSLDLVGLWDGTGEISAGSSVTVYASKTNLGPIASHDYHYALPDGTESNPIEDADQSLFGGEPQVYDGSTEVDVDSGPSDLEKGDVIRVVWVSDSGDDSRTLVEHEVY